MAAYREKHFEGGMVCVRSAGAAHIPRALRPLPSMSRESTDACVLQSSILMMEVWSTSATSVALTPRARGRLTLSPRGKKNGVFLQAARRRQHGWRPQQALFTLDSCTSKYNFNFEGRAKAAAYCKQPAGDGIG